MQRCLDYEALAGRIPPRIRPALDELWQAAQYARQTGGDPWEFSVEIEVLRALGLGGNDFRWLVRMGLVFHQREVTATGDNGRAFRSSGDLEFRKRTCFVLTEKGIRIARDAREQVALDVAGGRPSTKSHDDSFRDAADDPIFTAGGAGMGRGRGLPVWDAERHELRMGAAIVKRFKWPAVNQETVLAAFEEEGWPSRIDDPLRPQAEQDSKRRLSDTIKCLNRKQAHRLLHFRGDGSGQGVVWELVAPVGGGANEAFLLDRPGAR